jgi:hypothetical protein
MYWETGSAYLINAVTDFTQEVPVVFNAVSFCVLPSTVPLLLKVISIMTKTGTSRSIKGEMFDKRFIIDSF